MLFNLIFLPSTQAVWPSCETGSCQSYWRDLACPGYQHIQETISNDTFSIAEKALRAGAGLSPNTSLENKNLSIDFYLFNKSITSSLSDLNKKVENNRPNDCTSSVADLSSSSLIFPLMNYLQSAVDILCLPMEKSVAADDTIDDLRIENSVWDISVGVGVVDH